MKINLVSRVGAITLFFAAVSLGPQAVAWSYVATVAASYVITTRLGCVLLRMSVRAYASALLPAAACIGGATIVAVLLTHYLHAQPPGLRLLIVSGAYLVSYVALSSVCNVATMKSLRTAVAAFRKPKGGGISQFR